MKHFLFLSLFILFCSDISVAQISGSSQHVSIQVKQESPVVVPGTSFRGALILTVEENWHINSNKPTLDYLIPTTFSLIPKEGYLLTDIRYPEGKLTTLEFAEEQLSLYEDTVVIFFTIQVSPSLKYGTDTLEATLTVQACNNSICKAPSVISISIPLKLDSKVEHLTIPDTLFASYTTASTSTSAFSDFINEQNIILMLIGIFLIGLALNLTPCVYPMLSVTVSLFGSQTETRLGVVFIKALVYVLGMATMYSVLGVMAALGGGLFGSWLQSSYVLAGIALLLFALALSSFGLYQISMPYWLTSKLGGTTGTGIIGLYFSGLVVGLFAAPCVGPPVIALLTIVATKGDPLFGFWMFFTLALGLGFPYLILGTFSGLLHKIPRSGAWLLWVEHIFGVVLLAAGMFYLLLAVAPMYSVYVLPASLVLGGIYLGFIESFKSQTKFLKRLQWAFGSVAIVAGIVLLQSFTKPSIEWEPYSEQALADAMQNKQLILIDFYADWCIPCIELEHTTWTNPDIIGKTKSWKRLKIDLTHFDSPNAEALRKQYSIAGVPTILILSPDGTEIEELRTVGYIAPAALLKKIVAAEQLLE